MHYWELNINYRKVDNRFNPTSGISSICIILPRGLRACCLEPDLNLNLNLSFCTG